MRQLSKIVLLCSFLSVITVQATDSVRLKYPFAILNEDSGLVPESDVLHFLKIVRVSPPGPDSFFPVYQCYDAGKIKMNCEFSSMELGVKLYFGTLEAFLDGATHEYHFRHLVDSEECYGHLSKWKKLLKGQATACVAGWGRTFDPKAKSYYWVWETLRTRKGLDSFFEMD